MFLFVRQKWLEKKGTREMMLYWKSGCEEKILRVL
jgi:hypothetical protein